MPFRTAMRALLDGAARREELVALRETERAARMAVQEARVKALLFPPCRLESRAAPVDPPTRKDVAT